MKTKSHFLDQIHQEVLEPHAERTGGSIEQAEADAINPSSSMFPRLRRRYQELSTQYDAAPDDPVGEVSKSDTRPRTLRDFTDVGLDALLLQTQGIGPEDPSYYVEFSKMLSKNDKARALYDLGHADGAAVMSPAEFRKAFPARVSNDAGALVRKFFGEGV